MKACTCPCVLNPKGASPGGARSHASRAAYRVVEQLVRRGRVDRADALVDGAQALVRARVQRLARVLNHLGLAAEPAIVPKRQANVVIMLAQQLIDGGALRGTGTVPAWTVDTVIIIMIQ